jgi:hypothetical protein
VIVFLTSSKQISICVNLLLPKVGYQMVHDIESILIRHHFLVILSVRLWAVWGKSKYIAWVIFVGGLIPGTALSIYGFTQIKYLNSKPGIVNLFEKLTLG